MMATPADGNSCVSSEKLRNCRSRSSWNASEELVALMGRWEQLTPAFARARDLDTRTPARSIPGPRLETGYSYAEGIRAHRGNHRRMAGLVRGGTRIHAGRVHP